MYLTTPMFMISGMGLLEGKDFNGAFNEIRTNFLTVYSVRDFAFQSIFFKTSIICIYMYLTNINYKFIRVK